MERTGIINSIFPFSESIFRCVKLELAMPNNVLFKGSKTGKVRVAKFGKKISKGILKVMQCVKADLKKYENYKIKFLSSPLAVILLGCLQN